MYIPQGVLGLIGGFILGVIFAFWLGFFLNRKNK